MLWYAFRISPIKTRTFANDPKPGWSVDTVTTLSVTDASRKVGVSRRTIYEQIRRGDIKRTSAGIDLSELMRVYPEIANLSIEKSVSMQADQHAVSIEKTVQQAGTVELLIRELEWNKELLEQTNQLMARQLAEQRSLIADQARRLDEKDHFWARQVEIAQSLLPAPAPRKKFLGIF